MNILIVEDEKLVAEHLIRMVQKLEPDSSISGPLASVRECIQWIADNTAPDLVIADIQLSDGVSFNALDQLPGEVPVIFVTAFNEYALRAFRLNSIDYLLKPIEECELTLALRKLRVLQEKFRLIGLKDQMQQVIRDIQHPNRYKQRFLVYSGKSVVPVPVSQVAWFQKEEIIFLNDIQHKQFVTEYRSLDELQELIDPSVFYRANRQFLVRADCITRFETNYLGKIELQLSVKGHPEITVSKDKAADFKRWMEAH